jgi:hypothetical protein
MPKWYGLQGLIIIIMNTYTKIKYSDAVPHAHMGVVDAASHSCHADQTW